MNKAEKVCKHCGLIWLDHSARDGKCPSASYDPNREGSLRFHPLNTYAPVDRDEFSKTRTVYVAVCTPNETNLTPYVYGVFDSAEYAAEHFAQFGDKTSTLRITHENVVRG